MLDEEVVNKNTRHGNERLLIVNVLLMFALPAIFFGGTSDFITGLFMKRYWEHLFPIHLRVDGRGMAFPLLFCWEWEAFF